MRIRNIIILDRNYINELRLVKTDGMIMDKQVNNVFENDRINLMNRASIRGGAIIWNQHLFVNIGGAIYLESTFKNNYALESDGCISQLMVNYLLHLL